MEEKSAGMSLSELQNFLNKIIKCPAGRHQVYIYCDMDHRRRKSEPPRIALDCRIRKEMGWPRRVFEKYIREVCCDNPMAKCKPLREFMIKYNMTSLEDIPFHQAAGG